VAVTAWLHGCAVRPSAAWTVPVVWVWGTIVVGLATRSAPGLAQTLGVALLLRLLLVGTPPWLSDDLYRYLWEGLALLEGHQPLYESPSSLRHLAPPLADQVTHAHLPSVYPPLAMAWFTILAGLGGTPPVAQLFTALVDLITVAAIARRCPAGGWLYALLPVAVVESASGAHIDVVAIAWAAAAVSLVPRPWQGVLLWAGGMTKLFPFVALPTALRQLSPRRAVALAIGICALTAVVAAPFLRGELPPGLVAYGSSWSFNGFAWTLLSPILGSATRPTLLALGAAVGLASLVRRTEPLRVWHDVATAFVLLSPTVHPWYVLWAVVPDLLLGRRAWAAASVWLWGSYLVLLTYDPATGSWAEAPWLWWLTWLPAAIAFGACYDRREASPTAP